jgi:hypothetical protein
VLIGGVGGLLSLPPGQLRDLEAAGITTIATAAATGMLIATDAAALLVADGGNEIATAKDASLVLDDGQAPTTSTLVSLWQSNLIGIRVERFLKISARPTASAWAATA